MRALPAGLRRATKAVSGPQLRPSKTPSTGKSAEEVRPATTTEPSCAAAIPKPSSEALPASR